MFQEVCFMLFMILACKATERVEVVTGSGCGTTMEIKTKPTGNPSEGCTIIRRYDYIPIDRNLFPPPPTSIVDPACAEYDIDTRDANIGMVTVSTLEECVQSCIDKAGCVQVIFKTHNGECWRKAVTTGSKSNAANVITYTMNCNN